MIRVLRWLPVGGLLAAWVALLLAFVQGGIPRSLAWMLLDLVPFVSAPVLLVTGIVALVRRRAGPATLVTLAVSAVGTAWLLKVFQVVPVAFPADVTTASPALSVRLPSDSPLLVVWGGDDIAGNYHAGDATQRWAYDLVVPPALAGATRLEDHGCWGTAVLAPIAGTVARRVDGLPDHPPGELSGDAATPCGNHVALRVDETGTVLLVCHLQSGSVAVSVGDHLAEGAPIGRCGNSGNTSEPHIHLHHQRELPPEGILLGEPLPLYFRDHDGPPMPSGGIRVVDGRAEPLGPVIRHVGG